MLAVGMLLMATIAGFALGSLNPERGTAESVSAAGPTHSVDAARVRRAHAVRDLNGALGRLAARRGIALHRMNKARRNAEQATQAARVAAAYGLARRDLARISGSALDLGAVMVPLRASERAYRALAAAARSGDVRSYRAAQSAVTAREPEVEHAVAGLARRPG
jgi:hypothetical protein